MNPRAVVLSKTLKYLLRINIFSIIPLHFVINLIGMVRSKAEKYLVLLAGQAQEEDEQLNQMDGQQDKHLHLTVR